MIEKIYKKLNSTMLGEHHFLPAATIEQIAEFEKENHVCLPQQYKEWLMFSDGGELFLPAGIQLYGVNHNPIIDINDNDRPDDSYIVIGTLSFGNPIIFRKREERISIYNHAGGKIEEDETFENFYDFLDSLQNIIG